jgi:uncharacterized repeat protein (TIGR01451 family)
VPPRRWYSIPLILTFACGVLTALLAFARAQEARITDVSPVFISATVLPYRHTISPILKGDLCTSVYTITNQSSIEAMTIHEFFEGDDQPVHTLPDAISAGASKTYDLADIAELSDGYTGYVIVSADQPFTYTLDTCSLSITKEATPDQVQPGAQLTYAIHIINTGSLDLHATVTDTLPTHIMPGETSGGTAIAPGGQITWTPTITAPGGVWMETVVVTVEMDYVGPLTNVVQVTTEEGAAGEDSVTVSAIYRQIYLPLVLRAYP